MKTSGRICCVALLCCAPYFIPSQALGQSDDDKNFLATAAQSDQNEIKLSELAVDKATSPAVKAFAKKMILEHKRMSASMMPFAKKADVTTPTGLDADHQKEFDELSGKSGSNFDKEYIAQMVTDHSKALDAFTSEAKKTKNLRLRAAVLKGKTMVAAHKNMAYDLKKKL